MICIPDVSQFDKNLDGFVDESKLEDVFTKREARQVLEMADQLGELWQLKSESFLFVAAFTCLICEQGYT